jgi:esterase/lipase superfamily enzyme
MFQAIGRPCSVLVLASLLLLGASGLVAAQNVSASSPAATGNPAQAQKCPPIDDLRGDRAREWRDSIEKQVKALQVQLSLKREERDRTKVTTLDEEIRNLEGRIVEAVYRLDCVREDQTTRGDEFVEITNFYATNRKATGSLEPGKFYGKEDSDQLQYGKTRVTMPLRHELGNLELPSLFKLERSPDPNKHFVLKEVAPLGKDSAMSDLRNALGSSKSKSLLLFVHGFNISFEDAALRTAQLTNDLQFPGLVMFFSWPSDGDTRGYSHDEESVELARPALNAMLDDLNSQPFDAIYLLSHSMGTRLLANVLSARQGQGTDVAKIKELILAAPDINYKIFQRDLAPVLARMPGVTRTIYASSEDLALRASKAIHEYRRVGETTDGVLVFPGFETIDATKVSSFRRAWGHSYIFDSPLVLADFADSIVGHKAILERNLKRVGKAPDSFWVIE